MKVRFEIEVENAEALDRFPLNTDEIFRGANGKNFLLRDPLIGNLSIITCNRGIDDEHKQADMWCTTLPVNTRIIDLDEYEQDPIGQTYSFLADGLQTLRTEIKESCTEILNTIDQINQRDTVLTQGIHEDTLLEALRILSKSKEE